MAGRHSKENKEQNILFRSLGVAADDGHFMPLNAPFLLRQYLHPIADILVLCPGDTPRVADTVGVGDSLKVLLEISRKDQREGREIKWFSRIRIEYLNFLFQIAIISRD